MLIFFPQSIRYIFYFNDFTILLNYVVGGQSHSFQQVCCNIRQKKYGSFSPKMLESIFCQNPFSAILRLKKREKKVSMTPKPQWSDNEKNNYFLRLPLWILVLRLDLNPDSNTGRLMSRMKMAQRGNNGISIKKKNGEYKMGEKN